MRACEFTKRREVCTTHSGAHGGIYVETALMLPVLIMVVFASIFFFLCAARHFSLQMLANEIAKDISLAMRPVSGTTDSDGCVIKCRSSQGQSANAFVGNSSLVLNTYVNQMYTTTSAGACWKTCAQQRYLLRTDQNGLQVNATAMPIRAWYDASPKTGQFQNQVSPGDMFTVTLSYPAKAVYGIPIAMFGLVPNMNLVGVAVGIVEKKG